MRRTPPGTGLQRPETIGSKTSSGLFAHLAETKPPPPHPRNPRKRGPSYLRSKNTGSCENAWWAREDSNLQPDRYERSALTIELRARRAMRRRFFSNAPAQQQWRRPKKPASKGHCRLLRPCARRVTARIGPGSPHHNSKSAGTGPADFIFNDTLTLRGRNDTQRYTTKANSVRA